MVSRGAALDDRPAVGSSGKRRLPECAVLSVNADQPRQNGQDHWRTAKRTSNLEQVRHVTDHDRACIWNCF